MKTQVDYDLHGLTRIRLVDATPEDMAVVTRQVGPFQAPLEREPDIVIRFVDQLATSSRIRYLGLDAGFTRDAFLVLRSKHKSHARVQIPFERIGKGCEIVCERGLLQVPLLIPIINLTILSKGSLPLHASAFTYRGTGFLATGWSKGGKTETLLGFMNAGASYVGDEWVYLSGDGSRMYGIPELVRVWNWHLDSLPRYRKVFRATQRGKLRLLECARAGMKLLRANRMQTLVGKQLCVDVSPYELFGEEKCTLTGVPQKLLFVASHEAPEVTVRPLEAQEVARRMVFSLQEEQLNLNSFYNKFRFAFPEAVNPLVENSLELQTEILSRALEGKEAYEILHPYPVAIPSLYEAIRDRCVEK